MCALRFVGPELPRRGWPYAISRSNIYAPKTAVLPDANNL